MDPKDLLYSETHEWAHIAEQSGEKIATVGISAFAIDQLTDLVYMELPPVGEQVSAGSEFGEVESVKAVSQLYCPVGGEIVEVNAALPENLEKLGEDPYGEGWIIKVKVTDESGLSKLLDYKAYETQCSEEG